jgi:hypothetical protein
MIKTSKYSTISTPTLMTDLTYLEQEINLKLMKYEEIRQELCNRFPNLEKEDDMFQEKILVKKEK